MMDWSLPPETTRLVLVRHGEPTEESRGRCYGRLDVGLSARGLEQAKRTAAWLAEAPLAAIYASPRARAVESARPIAAARRLEVEVREAFREIDFGALEGLTYDEAAARHPEFYQAWMTRPTTVTFPGGESYTLLRRRVLDEATALRARHAGCAFAIVAHGGVVRALLADALGLPDEHIFRLAQDFAAVSVIDHLPGSAVVRLSNGRP